MPTEIYTCIGYIHDNIEEIFETVIEQHVSMIFRQARDMQRRLGRVLCAYSPEISADSPESSRLVCIYYGSR